MEPLLARSRCFVLLVAEGGGAGHAPDGDVCDRVELAMTVAALLLYEGAGGERRRKARCLQLLGVCCCMEEQRAWS